jgi:hypothetical protein
MDGLVEHSFYRVFSEILEEAPEPCRKCRVVADMVKEIAQEVVAGEIEKEIAAKDVCLNVLKNCKAAGLPIESYRDPVCYYSKID